jgi:hypothetical protein
MRERKDTNKMKSNPQFQKNRKINDRANLQKLSKELSRGLSYALTEGHPETYQMKVDLWLKMKSTKLWVTDTRKLLRDC